MSVSNLDKSGLQERFQSIISVALFCESQTTLTPFIFGLQGPGNLTSVCVR